MPHARTASRHFTLRDLGHGITAAIATDGGWAVGNAGIIDLGGESLVFDTFAHWEPAAELRRAVREITGRDATFVLNSHRHRDHIRGNQVFGDARIVTTAKSRDAMAEAWRSREAQVKEEGFANLRLEIAAEFRAVRAGEPETEADRHLWDGYQEATTNALEDYHLKIPDVVFDRAMTFEGSKRSGEAVSWGGGHSVSDLILHIPEARTAFLGDLLFIGYQPYLGDGDPDSLFEILDKVEATGATTLVLGHGPPGGPQDLEALREYVRTLQHNVDASRASGGGLAEALARPLAAPFAGWKWQAFRKENLEALLRRGAGPTPR